MPTRTQARPKPGYDWDQDGGMPKQGAGIIILKDGIVARVVKPSWFGTETVFRPFPCVSFDKPDTDFEPYRILLGDRSRFSDWIRRYACAWGVGNPAKTFLIKKPHRHYDPWTSPLGILYKAIEQACKRGHPKTAEWQPLREASMNRGKPMRGPSEVYMMQGAVIKHDKKDYVGANGPPLGWGKNPSVIFLLSTDTGKELVDLLNKEKPDYMGAPDDFEARYEHGDPVSPISGRYFHFWERGSMPRTRYGEAQPTQLASAFEDTPTDNGSVGYGNSKPMEKKGFEIEIAKNFGPRPAAFNKAGEAEIRSHWKHWDDVLYFPSEAEQARILFDCFPVSACMYAFEGHKDWIPEDVHKRLTNATTVALNTPVRADYQPDPGFGDDPFSDSTPVQVSTQQDTGNDRAPTAVEDSTVPQRAVAEEPGAPTTAVLEPTPQAPTAPSNQVAAATDARTADVVARLAAARSKLSK